MGHRYGTYVQGNLFRGNYKAPCDLPHTPRTGHSKANNIGYDVGYYGMLGYGLYNERAALGSVAGTIGRGLASAGRAILGGIEAAAPEIEMGAMIAGAPFGFFT